MKKSERLIEKLILLCGIVSVAAVVLITVFIFASGFPALRENGIGAFLLGFTWRPGSGAYGILPMLIGTLSITIGALIIGVPAGIGCAVFLSQMVKKKTGAIFKAAIELLAGIPSIVYGFFGLAVIVPAIRDYILPLVQLVYPQAETTGFSVLAGAIILAIMILPTIVSISENAISAVPREFQEASMALGADKRETIVKVLLPAAKSGIFSSIILAMGRAIGETMAVLLITGNMAKVPGSPLDAASTLTGTIALEMSYAEPEHQSALFAVGIVLFVMIVVLNGIAQFVMRRFGGKTS